LICPSCSGSGKPLSLGDASAGRPCKSCAGAGHVILVAPASYRETKKLREENETLRAQIRRLEAARQTWLEGMGGE